MNKKKKKRTAVRKDMRDKVLVEFNHRCVCCDAPYYNIHHIDEDPSNNAEDNLIILCPNCHQGRVHGNSIMITPEQLKMYKRMKSKSVFKPIYSAIKSRIKFIETDEYERLTYDEITTKLDDLIKFIGTLNQGVYYEQELKRCLSREPRICFTDTPISIRQQQTQEIENRYKKKIKDKKEGILKLVLECIEVQPG